MIDGYTNGSVHICVCIHTSRVQLKLVTVSGSLGRLSEVQYHSILVALN